METGRGAAAPAVPTELPFEFKGTAGQYFGIWIVNILLTIITLGIYAPWAKVRTKRYFYGNTFLAGAPFDYLASPLVILKGWAIALAILIVYNIVTGMFPATGIVFGILFLIALPWIVVRAMAFRARNSAYRNIRFSFERAYGEAVRVFVVNAILIPLTLGLAYPYYLYAMNRFLVNNSGYGESPFRFHARTKDFYKIYAVAGLMFALMVIVISVAMVPMVQEIAAQAREAMEAGQALPYADTGGGMDPDLAQRMMGMQFAVSGVFAIFYLAAFAYIQARTGNLVFNAMDVSEHRFRSDLRARDLAWLYFSNLLAIVCSFGLAIPWAKIRMARYRAARLALLPAAAGLDGFTQSQQARVSATGEEMGEVFGIDIGL